MRYAPGRTPIRAPRQLSVRTRATVAGIAVAGASIVGLALPGTANAATNASATTTFQAHPDSGNHGNWANDAFTRVATVTYVSVDSTLTDCGSTAKTCFVYEGTIGDTGSFTAISGAKSPQAGVTITGTPSGPFKGGSDVKFFSSSDTASAAGVPATVTGAGPVSTTDWVEQFFPAGTTFGAGPTLTDWGWAYSNPATCENWLDSISNSSGSLPADGDITGVNHCLTGTGPISTFVNHSASCLDNSGFNWAAVAPACLPFRGASPRPAVACPRPSPTPADGRTGLGPGRSAETASRTHGLRARFDRCSVGALPKPRPSPPSLTAVSRPATTPRRAGVRDRLNRTPVTPAVTPPSRGARLRPGST